VRLSERFARGAGVGVVRWLLGLLFLGAVGLYAAERMFGTTNEDMERLRITADSAVRASEAKDSILSGLRFERNELQDRVVSDSGIMLGLRAQRDGLTVVTRGLRRDLSEATTLVDSIQLYVKTIQVQDSTIKVCGLEVETCMQRGARLDSIVRVQDTVNAVLESDRDSLRVIVGSFIDITHSCKNGQANLLLFKFCKPDPTVTFLVGTVVGGVVACWATDCLGTPKPVQVLIHTPVPPEEPYDPPPPRKEPN